MRIVATCTTLPDRYNRLMNTLSCLKNQDTPIDKIYVTIPYKSTRLNKVYPPIPKEIKTLATIVRVKTDYGPLCKLFGALHYEHDPNTIIISVDDDCTYPSNLVSSLIHHHQYDPDVAICGTGALLNNGILFASFYTNEKTLDTYNNINGFNIPIKGRYIDLIHGFAGVFYKRSFFPKKKELYNELFMYPMIDKSVFCHDDVIISGYLKKNGIKMIVYKDIPQVIIGETCEDALSYSFTEMVSKFNKSIAVLQNHGMFTKYEKTSLCESPTYRAIIILLMILFIFLFIYILYKQYL